MHAVSNTCPFTPPSPPPPPKAVTMITTLLAIMQSLQTLSLFHSYAHAYTHTHTHTQNSPVWVSVEMCLWVDDGMEGRVLNVLGGWFNVICCFRQLHVAL